MRHWYQIPAPDASEACGGLLEKGEAEKAIREERAPYAVAAR